MRNPKLNLAYSPRDAGPALGIPAWRIRRACEDKLLIPRKVGVRSLIPADELLDFLRTFPPTPSSKRKTP